MMAIDQIAPTFGTLAVVMTIGAAILVAVSFHLDNGWYALFGVLWCLLLFSFTVFLANSAIPTNVSQCYWSKPVQTEKAR